MGSKCISVFGSEWFDMQQVTELLKNVPQLRNKVKWGGELFGRIGGIWGFETSTRIFRYNSDSEIRDPVRRWNGGQNKDVLHHSDRHFGVIDASSLPVWLYLLQKTQIWGDWEKEQYGWIPEKNVQAWGERATAPSQQIGLWWFQTQELWNYLIRLIVSLVNKSNSKKTEYVSIVCTYVWLECLWLPEVGSFQMRRTSYECLTGHLINKRLITLITACTFFCLPFFGKGVRRRLWFDV